MQVEIESLPRLSYTFCALCAECRSFQCFTFHAGNRNQSVTTDYSYHHTRTIYQQLLFFSTDQENCINIFYQKALREELPILNVQCEEILQTDCLPQARLGAGRYISPAGLSLSYGRTVSISHEASWRNPKQREAGGEF